MNAKTEARLSLDLAKSIRPLLAGNPPAVQGAALADLLSMWLAGHYVKGDAKATRKLRRELIKLHLDQVKRLIPVSAAAIGTMR